MSIEDTPLDELQWKSPEWVNAFGLRTDNVLEYFSQSPFFDRTSNNQVLKMQNQFTDVNYVNRPYGQLLADLKKMRGIEFVIAMVREPDFWIVRKQERQSEREVKPLADFYIIGASVYMAPMLNAILSSRLLSTSLNLHRGISQLQDTPSFSPSRGHYYEFGSKEDEKEADEKGEQGQRASQQGQRASQQGQPAAPAAPAGQAGDGSQISDSSANAFNNLLNISLQKNSVYLDEMPATGITDAALRSKQATPAPE